MSKYLMAFKGWGNEDGTFTLGIGIDQYINHSFAPNCKRGCALRDIEAGEEILEDYTEFDNAEWFIKIMESQGIWVPVK